MVDVDDSRAVSERGHRAAQLDRVGGMLAAAVVPLGLIVAGLLVPSAVDHVSPNDAYGAKKVLLTARHATSVRVGYLALIASLLCIAPATRRALAFAADRASGLVAVGWRLVAIGAAGGAVGNAFAPLVVPSTVGFDPAVMGSFVHHHETSAASYAIIAVYLLLPVGAVLLLVGLWRAATLPRPLVVLLAAALAVITPLRLGIESVADGLLLAIAMVLFHRARPEH